MHTMLIIINTLRNQKNTHNFVNCKVIRNNKYNQLGSNLDELKCF